MMKESDVISFFNKQAPLWNSQLIRDDEIIDKILDNARVQKGIRLLDVASGTGVLFPYYLSREVKELTAIDISPEMVRIAKEDFPQLRVICGNADSYDFKDEYDVIMIYNAFPHFIDPERLISHLSRYLRKGGILSVAHSMSRQELEEIHSSEAVKKVSYPLVSEAVLAEMMSPYFDVTVMLSDDRMYQLCGVKK